MNTRFKADDWIICETAQHLRAYRFVKEDYNFYQLERDQRFYKDKSIRLAYWSEIPKEFRIKKYLFY